ncbi:MAG TPA: B12-binding domain-containing protein [Pyrinomonadaceae bacterium]|nr:B12-binding domain-containing protein [Pyrinomonadaceae bacterium]
MTNVKFLTTKEVARLCRVSDATVKRWEDSKLLSSERTNGGHRRFRAEEVARFQRENNLGVKICHGDESAQTATTRRKAKRSYSNYTTFAEGSSASLFFNSLIAGREEEATNVLINEFLQGKPIAEIFDTTIAEAMRCVGELWMRGELTVAQEHLATRATLNAVHKLRNIVPVAKSNEKMAMCCAIEGDFHELTTHLAQMTFESEGLEVLNFGANTPLYSFADEVLHHSPDLVCISATILLDIDRLSRDYKEFHMKISKLKIPVILGGRVFDDERLRLRFPADLFADTFTDLAKFISSLVDSKFN